MKKSDLRKIIREEVKNILKEAAPKFIDNPGVDIIDKIISKLNTLKTRDTKDLKGAIRYLQSLRTFMMRE